MVDLQYYEGWAKRLKTLSSVSLVSIIILVVMQILNIYLVGNINISVFYASVFVFASMIYTVSMVGRCVVSHQQEVAKAYKQYFELQKEEK